jgi:hypothetical protein
VNFSLFFEKGFDLNLDKYNRPNRQTIDLTFTGSTVDTFNIELLNVHPKGSWNLIEKSRHADTLKVWITDSMVIKRDTLALKLSFLQQDSLGAYFVKKDTIKLYLPDDLTNKSEKNDRKKRRKIMNDQKSVTLTSNIGAIFDTYKSIRIESPEPIASFDTSKVRLYVKKDTTYFNISPKIKSDTANQRRFIISYPWEFGTSYRLTVDSTALHTIYGLYGKAVKTDFKTQEEEHYGKIICSIKNVIGPSIIQLLENTKEERVLKTIRINKDEVVTIPLLEPTKYLLKAIFDKNNNGVWDSGNLKTKQEPEEVCYYQAVIKVRSNWDNNFAWTLPDPEGFRKKIIDADVEAEKLNKKKKNPTQQKSRLF